MSITPIKNDSIKTLTKTRTVSPGPSSAPLIRHNQFGLVPISEPNLEMSNTLEFYIPSLSAALLAGHVKDLILEYGLDITIDRNQFLDLRKVFIQGGSDLVMNAAKERILAFCNFQNMTSDDSMRDY